MVASSVGACAALASSVDSKALSTSALTICSVALLHRPRPATRGAGTRSGLHTEDASPRAPLRGTAPAARIAIRIIGFPMRRSMTAQLILTIPCAVQCGDRPAVSANAACVGRVPPSVTSAHAAHAACTLCV